MFAWAEAKEVDMQSTVLKKTRAVAVVAWTRAGLLAWVQAMEVAVWGNGL